MSETEKTVEEIADVIIEEIQEPVQERPNDEVPTLLKPKRKLTEKQKEAFAKGREIRRQNLLKMKQDKQELAYYKQKEDEDKITVKGKSRRKKIDVDDDVNYDKELEKIKFELEKKKFELEKQKLEAQHAHELTKLTRAPEVKPDVKPQPQPNKFVFPKSKADVASLGLFSF